MRYWWFMLFVSYLIGATWCRKVQSPGWINCTRPHEEYQCGIPCQRRCSTLGERCPVMNIKCNDACYCIEGYARDHRDVCIRIQDCPPKSQHP